MIRSEPIMYPRRPFLKHTIAAIALTAALSTPRLGGRESVSVEPGTAAAIGIDVEAHACASLPFPFYSRRQLNQRFLSFASRFPREELVRRAWGWRIRFS